MVASMSKRKGNRKTICPFHCLFGFCCEALQLHPAVTNPSDALAKACNAGKGPLRKIKNAPWNVGAVIVDSDGHGLSVVLIYHAKASAKWQAPMSSREPMSVESFAVGREIAVEAWSVP
jgi:hypothetical protein